MNEPILVSLSRNDLYNLLKGKGTGSLYPTSTVNISGKMICPVMEGSFDEEFDWNYNELDALTVEDLWVLYLKV